MGAAGGVIRAIYDIRGVIRLHIRVIRLCIRYYKVIYKGYIRYRGGL